MGKPSFSSDGRRILTVSEFRSAQLWDPATAQPIGQGLSHQEDISSAVFAPDGKAVVTASKDGTVRRWEAIDGQPIGESMNHQFPVSSIALAARRHDDSLPGWP